VRRSRAILWYVGRRLLVVVPLLCGIVLVTFLLVRLGDANPAVLIAGPEASEETIREIERDLRLDQPVIVQFGHYVKDLATGDLGTSWVSNRPVTTEIAERLPATLELVVLGMAMSLLVGIVIGFVSAMRRNRPTDHAVRVTTLAGISMPIFWIGLLLIFVFAFTLGWLPSPIGRLGLTELPPERITGFLLIDSMLQGEWATFQSALRRLILPVATITIVAGSTIAKQARSSLVEVLDSDQVRYARALGLSRIKVSLMALHMAMPTILTFTALTFGFVIGGSALVETIFSWGGIGQAGINAITDVDFALVQGYVLTLAIISVLVYLATDLVVAVLDPRAVRL
jgi:ABC-type dipeptide/oligopeptide/nickel transport system permease component